MSSHQQDDYATKLQQKLGYPLRTPEPSNTDHHLNEEGLRIGDIGYVDGYGQFIDLFNVCFPLPANIRDAGVPPYEPTRLQQPSAKPALEEDYVFMNGVTRDVRLDELRVDYKFTAKSTAGAILILPSGATLSEIQHKSDLEEFRKVAAKHALSWCRFAKCDSLYLITGVYKTRSWTLGSFYKGFVGGEIHVERIAGSQAYKWKPAFEADWRGGPPNNKNKNHSILIKGFKMTIKWETFPVIEWIAQSESQLAREIASFFTALLVALKILLATSWNLLSRTTIEHSPRFSQPRHPLDVINRYLLDKNTGAFVAITHDNEWIDMLEKKKMSQEDMMEESRLRDLLEKEYTWYREDGTIYLQSRIEDTSGIDCESESLQPTPAAEDAQIVITHIRIENVTFGLGRIPVGFYVQLDSRDGTFKRTKVKSVMACDSVIQWDDLIQLPSDPSITVGLMVYATFEFAPMLGKGELLHELTICVGDLLNQIGHVITISKDGGELSPVCCSLLITVHQWHGECLPRASSQVDGSLDWEHSSELAIVTDLGHDALRRYHWNHCKADLDASVIHFKHALHSCGDRHPCRAVMLFNLAAATFATYQHNGTSLDLATSRYRDALELRPDGHPDRAATLLPLSRALLHHYEATGYEVSREGELQELIDDLIGVCPKGSHELRAAGLLHQTYERVRLRDSDDLVEVDKLIAMLEDAAQEPPEGYIDRPIRFNNLGLTLLKRFQLHHDLDYLDRAISWLEGTIQITPDRHLDKPRYLQDLSKALLERFKQLGDVGELDRATKSLCDAVRLTSNDHQGKPTYANNLGTFLLTRFEYLGELSDLQQAIIRFTDAVNLTPDDHPDKPGRLNNLGHSFHTRFRRLGDLSDLEQAIARFEDALNLTADDHPDKPRRLNNLGSSLLTRFERLGELSDLEQAISRQENAVDLTPIDHPDKPSFLNNLGNSFRTHFERFGKLSDLERAISRQEDAVDLTSDDHPDKLSFLNNLGNSLLVRFERLGELSDLERAISRQENAVDLIPDGHPDKPSFLNNLGNSFRARFKRLGKLGDLERAILRQEDAVDLTPDGHLDKFRHLNNLGNSFLTRFEHLGELSDLERAIAKLGAATDLTPNGHPNKPGCLDDLGYCFRTRFRRLGEFSDLEQAIARFEDAVNLTPDSHPYKPRRLNDLGNSFLARFDHLGELSDLERAISTLVGAVNHTPGDHPDKSSYLSILSSFFLNRFQRLGDFSDLEQAIARFEDALNSTADSHSDKPRRLNDLGNSFLARFERLGELSDLEHAISTQSDAVDLSADGHLDKPMLLDSLGSSFLIRFERLGELGDLERAISRLAYAVESTPDGNPDKPRRLNSLGSSFRARFERFGELSDLERAISGQENAVDLTPDDHPDKPGRLNNLGYSFHTRFRRLGDLSDLEQAIARFEDALNLTADDHPDKPRRLNNLGNSFLVRFERLGQLSDLERAILMQENAVDLTPDGHPDKPCRLSDLGNSFLIRFERLGELSDLERAISRQENAVKFTPDGHPDKPRCLNSLGNSFLVRFERLGELSDLERAIPSQENAVGLTPIDHPDKPSFLNSLGNSFRARFECFGELSDLERAISRQEDAVDLTSDDHPDKPSFLDNLGNSFLARFECSGELSDLERAISRQENAVDLTPDDHPDKPSFLNNLGNPFRARFERLGKLADLERAISLYSRFAIHSTGPATVRCNASLRWISCARASGHHSLLHAYSVAVDLLPQLAWLGPSLSHCYRELIRGANVVQEAAAAAVELGYPETAVEWLEQGQSTVWGGLLQLRSSYDELCAVHPDHARRLRDLSTALGQASTIREMSLFSLSEPAHSTIHPAPKPLEQMADRQRALAIERDKLLQEIRNLPGFERFLPPKDFSQLRASAHSGPVVVLNASKSRCDALIVLADVDNVIHVPLPNFTLERCEALQTSVKNLVPGAHAIPLGERDGRRIPPELTSQWEPILSRLWKWVVKPVMDALGFSTIQDLTRVFWCLTGSLAFLPIHAAGFYDTQFSQPGHKAFDFVISSYVPTLSILALSPEPHTASSNDLRFLAVRQPSSDGLPHLPGVDAELKRIREIITKSPSSRVILFESSVGTVEEVLALMRDADWVHFACHGIQDATNPTESGLCLADGRRLKLSDIIALSRPRGGLAFLSACQIAMCDKKLSDEAIHIAAGMLFAGYRGVVSTMWPISDRLAPEVARDVCRQLFSNNRRPDYREAARALQDAVRRLREDGASFSEWVPFIHVGL